VPGAPIKELVNGVVNVSWDGIDLTDIDGKPYTFLVQEVDASGADFTPESYVKKDMVSTTVTNSYQVLGMTSIAANKVWVGGPAVHPDVTFQLYRDNVALGKPITLTNGNTRAVWADLPDRDIQGREYVYTVDEVGVPDGYTKTVSGNTFTNTYNANPPPPEPTPTQAPAASVTSVKSVLIPVTGDSSNWMFYGLIFLLALIVLAVIVIKGKLFSRSTK